MNLENNASNEVTTQNKPKPSQKAQKAEQVGRLCARYKLVSTWFVGKGIGVKGYADLANYFEKAKVDDVAAFMAEHSAMDVIKTLLPALLAAELEAKKPVPANVEIKAETPAIEANAETSAEPKMISCTCESCKTKVKPNKDSVFYFVVPSAETAKKNLGLRNEDSLLPDDLMKVAVHKGCAWAVFNSKDDTVPMELAFRKLSEAARIENQKQQRLADKTKAEKKIGDQVVYTTKTGHWCKIGFNKTEVLLAEQALVPPRKFVDYHTRNAPITAQTLLRFAVPRWEVPGAYRDLELTPLNVALAALDPAKFGYLTQTVH